MSWLEIALDYRCNLRCIGCRACEDTGESLTGIRARLEDARARNIENLWIGGGEPTLRADLLSIVATGKKLGFARILVQTNGMRLAYPAYVEALVRAGVTDVSVNAKSHRAEVHDRLSRGESHALLVRALENLTGKVALAADVLLAKSTAEDLPETIAFFADRGVTRFTLWLLSAADIDDPEVHAEVPRIADLHRVLRQAVAVADARNVELVSMHTPPCTLPAELRGRYFPARSLALEVVDPSGRAFPLEASPFEGGAYMSSCSACSVRPACHGPRADYLRLHGAAEMVPLPEPQ
ncbi:MAG: radical SAM protein [Polyangiales bacterium]